MTLLRAIGWEKFPGCKNCHFDNDNLAFLLAGFRCAAGAGNLCSAVLESFVPDLEYKYFQSPLSLLSEDEMK